MIQRHVIFFSLLGMILVIGLLSYLGGDGQILMLCMVSLLYLIVMKLFIILMNDL